MYNTLTLMNISTWFLNLKPILFSSSSTSNSGPKSEVYHYTAVSNKLLSILLFNKNYIKLHKQELNNNYYKYHISQYENFEQKNFYIFIIV